MLRLHLCVDAFMCLQRIDEIPSDVKELYRTIWEIPQKTLINMAAARGAFIDQSQSFNVFIAEPNFGKLTSMHFYAWKKGLKTGMYYLRTKPAANAIQFTVDQERLAKIQAKKVTPGESLTEEEKSEQEAAMVCSLENREACVMCSG